MKEMPNEYYQAMHGDTRQVDIYISLGAYSDLTAADDLSGIQAIALPMSNTDQLIDAIYEMTDSLATFENYGIPTWIGARMVAPPIRPESYPPETGLWSDDISDAEGNIDWTINVTLSAVHSSGITLHTKEVAVVDAVITFYQEGQVVSESPMVSYSDRVSYEDLATFDAFTVHITRLEQAFRHVRIVELEFGSAMALSKNNLMDEVRIIQEYDPTMLSLPVNELDFSIINVLGDWDYDNPAGNFDAVSIGNTVNVAFTCVTANKQWTVEIGRFFIADLKGSENKLSVSCYDPRRNFSMIFIELELNKDISFGTTLNALLTEYNIPHTVDSELFTMYPEFSYTFEDRYNLSECLLFIEQYYNIWLVPQRNGSIHVQNGPPYDFYGDVDDNMQFTWPTPHPFESYNVIQVAWKDEDGRVNYYTLDMRTDSKQPKTQISVSNPLVMSEQKAIEMAYAIRRAMFSEKVEMTWRTDLRNDLGDLMGLFGRYANGNASEYHCIYNLIEYNGGVMSTIRCIR